MRQLRLFFLPFLLAPALALSAPPAPAPTRATTFDPQRRLDVNNLNLFVSNFGSIGYDVVSSSAGLLFPRGGTSGVLFSSGLWVAAAVNGQPRVATTDYASEYGPGAMAGGVPENHASAELVVWKVLPWSGVLADTAHVGRTPAELATDPAMDPVAHHGWGEYMANAATRGAPTRSWSLPGPGGVGTVNVSGPDVTGDQLLWCVYNDGDASLHHNYGGSSAPLGVEVQQSVFGFNRSGALGQTAFIHWHIVNRGGSTLVDTRVAYWLDPDIGDWSDDLVGYDTGRSLGIAYNATNADAIYGSTPPALGADLLTPTAAAFSKYINGVDPGTAAETVNFMSGLNPDGSPVINPLTGLPATFQVSGDPVTGTGWLDSSPADRRMLLASAPRTLAPDEAMDVWAALVVGQDRDRLSSITQLKCHDDYIHQVWALGFPADLTGIPYVCGGATATLASLVSASAQPGYAELEWAVERAGTVQVQRAGAGEGWQALGAADPGSGGRVSWRDTGVEAGTRYGYRLALGPGGAAPFAGETWIEIPRSVSLAIAGFTPNPGVGPVSLAFSLPGTGRAQLEVHDASGRRVLSRDVSAFGPGAHAAPLGAALAPGIYWLRLTQGERSVSTKGVLLR